MRNLRLFVKGSSTATPNFVSLITNIAVMVTCHHDGEYIMTISSQKHKYCIVFFINFLMVCVQPFLNFSRQIYVNTLVGKLRIFVR